MNNNIEYNNKDDNGYDNGDDNGDDNIDIMKRLKLIQSIYYRYISTYTENQHLKLIFSHYGMQLYKQYTPYELLENFPYKNKLIN